jgi:CRISPR-associated protein Cas5h
LRTRGFASALINKKKEIMNKLISFDIKADFGMLKKPDTNEPVYLTFNMLHKPALLGILGAIAGLRGFIKNGELPEYYKKLSELKVSIMPLEHEKGNFSKTIIKYNNGTGMASEEKGGNLIVAEQTLIAPAFRCFVLLDTIIEEHKTILNNILNYKAVFIPYLGKNECALWWENAQVLEFDKFKPEGNFKIESIFIKQIPVKDSKVEELMFDLLMDSQEGCTYTYFENLPIAYLDAPLFQYEYRSFAFTDWDLSINDKFTGNLIQIRTKSHEKHIVQLF